MTADESLKIRLTIGERQFLLDLINFHDPEELVENTLVSEEGLKALRAKLRA